MESQFPRVENTASSNGERGRDGLWRMVFDAASVGVILLDRQCRFLEANRRWFDMLGYTDEDIRRFDGRRVSGSDLGDRPSNRLDALLRGEIDGYRIEKTYVRKNGTAFWGELSVNVVRGFDGVPRYLVGVLVDISEHKRAEEKLQEANERLEWRLSDKQVFPTRFQQEHAARDALTGLFNRRYLEDALDGALALSARDGRYLSLTMIDIDHLKSINDSLGHQAGDAVLKALAALLRNDTRGKDIACRYGGDEFVVIFPGAPLRDAVGRAEAWRRAFMALRIPYEGLLLSATLCAGSVEYPRHGLTAGQLLFEADEALQRAKRQQFSIR